MKKLFVSGALALLLAACAPAPITLVCDREAQPYDKFHTAEDVCYAEAQATSTRYVRDFHDDGDRDKRPRPNDRPTDGEDGGGEDDKPNDPPSHPNPKPPVKDKPKGNASANNGKGGNYDKTGHSDNNKGEGRNNSKKGTN